MRMMKRVAVSILAAAMALSLMTACGGGDAPSAPETPSNPGTSQGEEKKDDSTGGKPEDKKDDEKKDPPAESKPEDKKDEEVADGSTIEFNKSRTYKWALEYRSAQKVYIKVEPVKPASQDVVCMESVADGRKSYTKVTYKNGKAAETLVDLSQNNVVNQYELYSNQKIAIMKSHSVTVTNPDDNTVLDPETNYTVKKTTRVINAVPYYTEAITMEDKDAKRTETQMFCYDNTGSLVYLVSSPDTADEQIVHIQCSKSIPDSAILSIPNGWSVYTVTYGASYNDKTVKDQNGHELTDEEKEALEKKIGGTI
ncbi:hypothetical protein [Faecalibacterium prausnitzii]|jgi:hypothetical protein|uniref:hypothetical protein n=1 Tax=Faecalibacterium prausnitzii TaxID=853 RepID=UPI001CBF91DE|nr:hypothetical protein [Faecalibacterium prausnitzii]